ncbi:MAG TPA: imidazolonepropionase [Terriglobales bacterium]|nr:imidazolonepropionase [Terriglobales bacterium]
MRSADCVVAGCRQLVTCRGPLPKRGEALRDVGVVENGWLASDRGRIVFAGAEKEFRAEVVVEPGAVRLDGGGLVATPGFVDAHTHLPFAGDRQREFGLRLRGWTYQQLASEGMGILTTVRATRAASREELLSLCLRRLDEMLLTGTTTVEAKSGYGLDLESELKQLEVLRELGSLHPIDVVPTFMGAHEVAPEYRDRRGAYIDLLVTTLIPEVRRRDLAEFFDVFCEPGYFSLAETEVLAAAAREAGFKLKVHAEEFATSGGAELAARLGAVSAEHLISVDDRGVAALAASGTAAVCLPGVPFFLMLAKKPPARRLIEAGAAVALASDFNPGSSHISSMLFVLQLGVFTLGLSVEEAVNACTGNGAYAIDRHREVGTLEPGKKMDVLLLDASDYVTLAYRPGSNPIRHVIKDGRLVVRDGRKVETAG